MNHIYLTLTLLAITFSIARSQTFFSEDFESGSLPADWSIQTNATDGGWSVGTASALSSQFWPIESNGSTRIIATNDDGCNCDKSMDYLVTPPMDFSGLSAVALKFDMFYGAGSYQGDTERATVEVSLDGVNWEELTELHGHGDWDTHTLNLSEFAGEDSVYIGFHYDDNGGWLYGMALDNIAFEIPPLLDAEMAGLNARPYGEENSPMPIGGVIFNGGVTTINTLEIAVSVNGNQIATELFDNLDVEAFSFYDFNMTNSWMPDMADNYEITVEIVSVNGSTDENPDNNTSTFDTEIFVKVVPPNRIDEYLLAEPMFVEVANAGNQLDKPTDLDFFPILGKDELWVINERDENSGGSTLTIYNASTEDPDYLHRVDGNAWHFMSLPTGIAFSDNFNFANSPGVQDANHSGGTFTGPALWSSDPDIYAQPSGGNGSHLDMLHGSPYSMGIAHETDNVFWIFDGWNEEIVRYDFQDDHGPGNDDHSDAIVRRYTEIEVKRDGNVPSHLVLDNETGWMYVVDNGNDRVLRLDINSGSVVGNLPFINEPLAEHSEMGNVTWEVIIQDSIQRPSGIELIENRLLVGDYASGDIYVYDMENNFAELGRIPTGEPGLTGLKIGPDGSIWFTNRQQNSLYRMEPGMVSNSGEEAYAARVTLSPNPASGQILITLPEITENSETEILISDLTGKTVKTFKNTGSRHWIELGNLPNGMYSASIRNENFVTARRIILEK